MDLLSLISNRKSVRKYLDKHIPDEDLRKILESGRLAPSWMNVQSWKFILVKSQENKDLLSELSIGQPQVKNAEALIEKEIENVTNPKVRDIAKERLKMIEEGKRDFRF